MVTVMGVAMIILGVCILAAPVFVGIVSVVIIGALMALAGVAQLVRGLRETETMPRAVWALLGLVTLIGGILVAVHPVFGLGFLTLLLAAYFFADGIIKISAAMRYENGRGWFVANGILSFVLAYMIWTNWPLSGGWAIGILVGINFVCTGIMTLMVRKAIAA